jgi:CRISPR-associated protein Cas1
MIKKTLYFGNPAYLSVKMKQLVIRMPKKEDEVRTVPIEDVGIVILDNAQITLTQVLIETLLENNCALITCGSNHLPVGLMLPLYGNTIQNERFRQQIDASLPLKKQLWQQTIQTKIINQAAVLSYSTGENHTTMQMLSQKVRSGDPDNIEGQAAVYYWKTIFNDSSFVRDRDDDGPNALLNYGYAILRAIIARSLVSSGLLPTLGIHHHNRYNAYCLADDIMEPYRPYVDKLVIDIIKECNDFSLSKEIKARLLSIPVSDVIINGKRSPLMVAATLTTASLAKCFSGEARKIIYPIME